MSAKQLQQSWWGGGGAQGADVIFVFIIIDRQLHV